MKKILSVIASLFFIVQSSYADSPLTSTDFYQAYLDVPIVKAAADNPNVLTEEMMDYLYDDANPLDVRMALVNAVGWNVDKRLSTIWDYQEYCINRVDRAKYGFENKLITAQDLYAISSPDQMALFVYLYALADYFNMQPAYTVAEIAMQNPVSKQSFMLPMALVWAQIKLDLGQWEEIYPSVKMLFLDAEEKDMRPEAIDIIMDYINDYKKYTESKGEVTEPAIYDQVVRQFEAASKWKAILGYITMLLSLIMPICAIVSQLKCNHRKFSFGRILLSIWSIIMAVLLIYVVYKVNEASILLIPVIAVASVAVWFLQRGKSIMANILRTLVNIVCPIFFLLAVALLSMPFNL